MNAVEPSEHGSIPKDAVLLIPDPEEEGEEPTCGIQPGCYNAEQMLDLLEKHQNDAEAIQFIADMLETGDPEDDGFVEMLRANRSNPTELAGMIAICRN